MLPKSLPNKRQQKANKQQLQPQSMQHVCRMRRRIAHCCRLKCDYMAMFVGIECLWHNIIVFVLACEIKLNAMPKGLKGYNDCHDVAHTLRIPIFLFPNNSAGSLVSAENCNFHRQLVSVNRYINWTRIS